ncbi:LGFP repeat-containing protein [Mycobacterium kyorinense]|uniref:LGFP repeat-containing protein n=1 Tax=Mycobacterium kyorinense TaxID=487514 RepID=UPI001F1D0443|nr:hypothetical protein [Mycobacterium kyorinense]
MGKSVRRGHRHEPHAAGRCPFHGAHILLGGIGNAWHKHGGAGGQLGYPTSDEQPIPGGWQQHFQHGTITYTDGPHIRIS